MAQARASPGSFGVKRAVQLDDRFWPGQALPTRFVNSTRLPNGASVNPRRLPSRLLIAAATLRVDGPSCVVTSTKNVGTPSDAYDAAGVARLGFAQPRSGEDDPMPTRGCAGQDSSVPCVKFTQGRSDQGS